MFLVLSFLNFLVGEEAFSGASEVFLSRLLDSLGSWCCCVCGLLENLGHGLDSKILYRFCFVSVGQGDSTPCQF